VRRREALLAQGFNEEDAQLAKQTALEWYRNGTIDEAELSRALEILEGRRTIAERPMSSEADRAELRARFALTPATLDRAGQPIYRGLGPNHPRLGAAREGLIVPTDPQGHIDAGRHRGGETDDTGLTSWSFDKETARRFATEPGVGTGILLEMIFDPRSPENPGGHSFLEIGDFRDSEVMLEGPARGARPTE
jgi:hypothetical protein